MLTRPFRTLSLTLILIALISALAAYFLVLFPDTAIQLYWDGPIDNLHRSLAIALGAWILVTAVMAVMAFLKPLKHSGLVTLLIVTHFAIFTVDIVILARGFLGSQLVFVEIAYVVIVCVLLVRFYPTDAQLQIHSDALEHRKFVKSEEKRIAKEQKIAAKEQQKEINQAPQKPDINI